MKQTMFNNMESVYFKGIHMIENQDYDKALTFFENIMDDDHHLIYYGYATALFKKKNVGLSEEETRSIIDHYDKAIGKKKNFADAYLFQGMALEQLASLLTREYKKNPYIDTKKKTELIKGTLLEAKLKIEKAIELNPLFKEIAISEIDRYNQRIEGIDNLVKYYTAKKNQN
ncbi:hypothetical protein ACFL1H_00545 [Nanoarchaeota archaeon]